MVTTEYRILICRDTDPYEAGDAEDADECARIAADEGVYGFIAQSRSTYGAMQSDWEDIDSCFGFLGCVNRSGEMMREHCNIPEGIKIVPIYEEDDDSSPIGYWDF